MKGEVTRMESGLIVEILTTRELTIGSYHNSYHNTIAFPADGSPDDESTYYAVRLPLIVADEGSSDLSVVWDVVMMNRCQIEFLMERVQIIADYWMRLNESIRCLALTGK